MAVLEGLSVLIWTPEVEAASRLDEVTSAEVERGARSPCAGRAVDSKEREEVDVLWCSSGESPAGAAVAEASSGVSWSLPSATKLPDFWNFLRLAGDRLRRAGCTPSASSPSVADSTT